MAAELGSLEPMKALSNELEQKEKAKQKQGKKYKEREGKRVKK